VSDRVLRVQEQMACEYLPVGSSCARRRDGMVTCDGCNGDGTRRVTVGTLRQPGADGCRLWLDSIDEYTTWDGDGDWPRRALYVIEEQT